MAKFLIILMLVLVPLTVSKSLSASEKILSDKSSEIQTDGLRKLQPGLILPAGRAILDAKGRPIIVYTPDDFRLTIKIFNNYSLGLANETSMEKLRANYKLHLTLKTQIILEKDKQIEVLNERVEIGDKMYQLARSDNRLNKVKLIFGTIGGIGVGLLIGFCIGAIAL